MFDTLKALTQNTTPKISLVIHNEYLDRVGDEQPARFTTITWQWSDETGNWASLDVLGAIDDSPAYHFDPNTLDYNLVDCRAQCSDDSLTESELWELQSLMEDRASRFHPATYGYTREGI